MHSQRRKVSLPTYPFQRQRYWVETQPSPARMMAARDRIHPLLGQRLQLAGRCQDIFFETSLSAASPAYLSDHRVLDKVILPGAAYVEMVLAAGAQIFQSPCLVLEQVFMAHPLLLSATQATTVQVVLSPTEKGVYTFEVASLKTASDADSWQVHVSGKLRAGGTRPDKVMLEQWHDRGAPLPLEPFYRQSQAQGLAFGECFQSLTQAWTESGEGYAQVKLPLAAGDADNYHLHPILLDGGFQLTGAMLAVGNQTQSNSLYLPVAIERLEVYCQAGPQLWVQANVRDADTGNSLSSDFRLVDPTGNVVAQVEGFTLRQATRQGLQRALEPDLSDWFYTLDWRLQPLERSHPLPSGGRWMIFTSGGDLGEPLLQQLQQQGHTCIQVSVGSSYQRLSDTHYQVNPLEPDDFRQLLQACCHERPQGIIHLWSLESSAVAELDTDGLQQAQVISCGSVLHLLQGLSSAQAVPLYLVTQGAQSIRSHPTEVQVQQAPLWGLGRVIALEYPAIKCQRLDLDPNAAVEMNVGAIAAEMHSSQGEDQVAYRQNQRFVARLLRQREAAQRAGQRAIPQGQPYQLKLSAYGSPDHLSLQPMTRRAPAAGEVEVQMQAVGLNFRDVLNTLGVLKDYYAKHFGITDPQQLTFGFEGVGRVVALGAEVTHLQIGDEVMVTMIPDGFSSHVTIKAEWVIKKPPQLSAAEAATLPLVCLTAQYGLSHLAQLQPGERVLIHAAAGGVGQAAVQIAQRLGAEIYATASPGKWAFLRSQGIKHIFNSRSLAFADQIKLATGGVGVDVVLNSLNGDHIPKSLDVLAPGGRFIEIGKAGIWSNAQVRQQRPDVAYFPFDLGEVGQANPPLMRAIFEQFQQAITGGELKSLHQQVYPITRVVEAFRLMQRGQNLGKVVVTLLDVEAAETSVIQSEGSYLITGGLGALGLQVAQALAEQGAHYLVLMGIRSPSAQAQTVIKALQAQGVKVSVELTDVADFQAVAQMMTNIEAELPPLRGVIHAAGVLEDGLLQQMSWPGFAKVMAPKVLGAWNLHQLTQQQPLDFFVCFSSITALMGNATQGNYAAANTFLDALAHHRRAMGLPGLSINWGPWATEGMAARLGKQYQSHLQALGIASMTPQQGVNSFTQLLSEPDTQVGVFSINWSNFLKHLPGRANPPFLEEFASKEVVETKNNRLLEQLRTASASEKETVLTPYLQGKIARVLGMTASLIDIEEPLNQMGLDSLMTVELRAQIQRELTVDLPIEKLIEGPSITQVATLLLEQLALADVSASTQPDLTAYPETQEAATTSPEENFEDLLTGGPKAVLPGPRNLIARVILWIFGFLVRFIWSIEVVGQEHLSPEPPFILCANHESHFDSLWITSCLSPRLRYQFCTLAKQEHFEKRIPRLLMSLLGSIPVDRQGDSLPALRTAAQGLLEKRPLFIHPEGTRTRTGKLLPFRRGAAKLAIATGSSMIPVRIIGAYEIFPPDQKWPSLFDWKHWRRRQLKIVFGAPIEPSQQERGLQAEILLTDQLRQAIIALHCSER